MVHSMTQVFQTDNKLVSEQYLRMDEVSVEFPLQDFEVYRMNLENSSLWKMKTQVGLGRGGQGLGG